MDSRPWRRPVAGGETTGGTTAVEVWDNSVRFRTTSGLEGKVSYETVPGIQGDVAADMFEKLTTIIAAQHLSFGGGTVLAARWNHRKSLDVDLFCEPTIYGRLSPRERTRVERAIHEIAGCASSQTWCEDIATYTEIRGVEATVLPGIIVIEPGKPTTLDGTRLALQSSAQILYGKIAWRMYEGGEIAVRDAYDLASARKHDPQALAQARAHVSPRVLATVSEIIRQLPQGWSAEPEKALIEPRYAWSEAELQEQALAALRTRSGRMAVRRGGPER